jgi:glycosyltransferase involved in cell wall biosynthesis
VGQPKVSKRGYLVSELAQEMNLPFYSAHPTRQSFVTMPGFYNAVDVIVCSSSDEGAGGPVLEGGAAGRLIITTATGGFSDLVTNIGADVVPVEDNLFKQEAKRIIQFYIDNPVKYRERCKQIQDYAIETYDLSKAIDTWVNLITN